VLGRCSSVVLHERDKSLDLLGISILVILFIAVFSGLLAFFFFRLSLRRSSSLSVSLVSLSLDSLELLESLCGLDFFLGFVFLTRTSFFFFFALRFSLSARSSLSDGSVTQILRSSFSAISRAFVADLVFVTTLFGFLVGL
jgi:hypothetical protein